MTVRKSGAAGAPARQYHHGNLRRAVIDAALQALVTQTPEALSLRELARGVGVRHSALYTHFRDRDELLAVVAGEGFADLEAMLRAAKAADPEAGVGALAMTYISFARARPAHYRTMFRPENLTEANIHHVSEASDRCFLLLIDAVQERSRLSEAEARERSIGIWSMLHGLVVLGENSGPMQQKVSVDDETALAARLAQALASS